MPSVYLPTQLRPLVQGADCLQVEATTVGELIAALESRFPGIGQRLVDGERLAAGLAVAVDGQVTPRGLLARLRPDSEVHFVPAIGGG